ncbi:uncharacterized protein [Phyllobates terribilis]|uniref:uncharacterized protein n=1 Tax=Phyllobates terribilis TaxID=111132 RepID=UPI003CCB27B9
MSQFFNYSGDEDFYLGGSIYSNSNHADVLFPFKRARINSPVLPFEQKSEETSINSLPDECLFEIFRRLPGGGKERSACAFVSKRWLGLVSSIRVNELSEKQQTDDDGFLLQCLEGKKATDIRLAAMAVGMGPRGGLGKLIIKGTNPNRGVTSLGLRAIAASCPSLKVLSLWDVPSIGDEGLIEIAKGCSQLEKLDLLNCPMITDNGLSAIAMGCPNLSFLNIDSCENIGNSGLESIGKFCPNLKSVSVKDCPLVGDQGITSLVSSLSTALTKLKLHGLSVTDVTLAVIGYYCHSLTDLALSGLQNIGEKGFWCMGNGHALLKLKTLTILSCRVTDLGLESIGKGCRNLKSFSLRKCAFLSDNGLVAFSRVAGSLESLQLDECHRITQVGFFGIFLNCGVNLKAVSVSNCFGIREMPVGVVLPKSATLRSLMVRNCPYFGDVNVALLSTVCTELQHLELISLPMISDYSVIPLLEACDAGLVNVKLGRCVNITDNTVAILTRAHGGTLELISLDGCSKITDASLVAIAEYCLLLNDLDLTRCGITDFGVSALSRSNQVVATLRVLSVSGCVQLSDRSFSSFMKLGSNLDGLNLMFCNGISASVTDKLDEKLRNCDILS